MFFPRILASAAALAATGAAFSADTATQSYDLVVIEATPAGIAMAVRGAREGLKVALVNHTRHLGGILSNGVSVWDSEYEGRRSPLYDAVRQSVFDHYRSVYGPESRQYHEALPGKSGHTNGKFEAHVMEKILTDLVSAESNITLLTGYVPVAVERRGATLASVTVQELDGSQALSLHAAVFADCTYEGDVIALAHLPYRVGREGRSEYGEPHAGVVYMAPAARPPTSEIARDHDERMRLKLRPFDSMQKILPESTGASDGHVQAINYRTLLSTDPANRVPIVRPAHYDPAALRRLDLSSVIGPVPNDKLGLNRPQILGAQDAYIEGDWTVRRRVMDQFWDATLGLLYFYQNDPSVPPAVRAQWRPYGLAKDEYVDNGHRPYEIYVREARRLLGRYVFTEHDLTLAGGLHRTPVPGDAIAFTDWYVDVHGCTTRRVPGSLEEGKMMLETETFPAQVPYRTLLPRGVDNLLVPVAVSATHVGLGVIRLEPAYMEIGEAAGYAAVLSIRGRVSPARLDSDTLVRELARRHFALSFFNDVNPAKDDPAVAAAEYFSAKGFFAGYDARLEQDLSRPVARVWAAGLKRLLAGHLDAEALALSVDTAEASGGRPVTAADFAALLPAGSSPLASADGPITRGQALVRMWNLR